MRGTPLVTASAPTSGRRIVTFTPPGGPPYLAPRGRCNAYRTSVGTVAWRDPTVARRLWTLYTLERDTGVPFSLLHADLAAGRLVGIWNLGRWVFELRAVQSYLRDHGADRGVDVSGLPRLMR